MASALYAKGRNAFLTGDIDWVADTIKVALVGSGYTANMSTDQYYSSVSDDAIGTPMTLSNKSASNGVADADDVTSGNLTTGDTITQAVIYKDSGSAASSPLIARFDLTSTPTNGGTVTLTWDSGSNKIFAL
jgi:hypothetical protein